MNEEYQERSGRGLMNLLLIVFIVSGIVLAMWQVGIFGNDSSEDETTEEPQKEFTITEEEWKTHQSRLHQQHSNIQQMRAEIKQLQNEVNTLKQAKPTVTKPIATSKSAAATTTAKTTTSTSTTTSSNATAITMVSYTHTWLEETAKISLRNNTDKTITKISARISYYDMNGNMLDYRDITKEITIEPKMSRACTIPGFGADEHYAYYKSDTFYSQQRKYKVKFELKSYTIK